MGHLILTLLVSAFQIHRGPAMQVQIKDVLLKELPAGGVGADDWHSIQQWLAEKLAMPSAAPRVG